MAITINGTTGLAGVDGSASTPAVQGTDTNTGIFFPAADTIAFGEGGVESMRIDSSGNVGIGVTPSYRLEVKGPSATAGQLSIHDGTGDTVVSGNNAASLLFQARDTSVRTIAEIDAVNTTTNGTGGAMVFQTRISDVLAERMRIDSSGIAIIGATSARTTQAKLELRSSANTALSLYMFKDTQVEATLGFKSSTDSNFYVGSGSTSVGTNGVYLTNAGNSWNAVSDERMKTIIEPIENASEKVSSLRAVIGYYNNDESQIRRPFLIAQDVQEVLPEAVNVQDVETGTLGMSYTDTIPLLVAAIKEQQALITQLQADVAALKGTP